MNDIEKDATKFQIRAAITVSQISARSLLAVAHFFKELGKRAIRKTGRIPMQRLLKDGKLLSAEDVESPDLKLMRKVMGQYKVGFSVIKHRHEGKYTLLFKADDQAQFEAAMREYTARSLSRKHPAAQQQQAPEQAPGEAAKGAEPAGQTRQQAAQRRTGSPQQRTRLDNRLERASEKCKALREQRAAGTVTPKAPERILERGRDR